MVEVEGVEGRESCRKREKRGSLSLIKQNKGLMTNGVRFSLFNIFV